MYWDINRVLSYNCLFNFIVGARGVGKSFGAKKRVIDNFLKNGEQWVYVRRFDTELENVDKYFDDIKEWYPEHEFKYSKGEFKIDKITAGYVIALSKAKIQKSTPFPFVGTIIFDEFILDKGYHHYLPDEVTNFLELYNTVARLRDVRVFFLSNALSVTNPYFLYFNLSLPYGKDIKAKDDILIQMIREEEYAKTAAKTRFGKIIANTPYGNYAIENEFFRDDNSFIGKKPSTSYYQFTLAYKGVDYGIWLDRQMSYYYVSTDVDPNSRLKYSVTLDDHKPNLMLLKTIKPVMLDTFLRAYSMGTVRFENMNVKNMCQEIIKLTL